jgi:hypothetical protein
MMVVTGNSEAQNQGHRILVAESNVYAALNVYANSCGK